MSGSDATKVCVVSGGSRGIGRAIARRLAQDGYDCLLAARTEEDLRSAAQLISEESGRRVEICPADLRTMEGCRAALSAVEGEFGQVDVLVNCAGATKGGLFLEQEDSDWEDGFALKFFGAVRLCRLLWPLLKSSKGTVVNIVGGFARTPDPDFMIGGSVNAALTNFGKALSGLGLRDDVNVNTVHPGMTVTERLDEIFAGRARLAGTTAEEAMQASIEKEGVRRFGQPEDVAELVRFLCSAEARHIQGAAIAIDGGATSGVF